jgi:hypothetical protein
LQRVGWPQRLTGATAGDGLKKVPTVRGWGGKHEGTKDWMVVGTGKVLELVESLEGDIDTGNLEEEWVQWALLLPAGFVQYTRGHRFIRFLCPNCSSQI